MEKTVQHVALIMDGNGRWANRQCFPRSFGHKKGAAVMREIVTAAIELSIRHLTVYALSSDNLSRPEPEVVFLLALAKDFLSMHLEELRQRGVKLRFIGDVAALGKDLHEQILLAEEATKDNQALVLTIALNFSGSWHIVQTTKRLLSKGGEPSDEEIYQSFQALLPSSPDVLIRTGGDKRLSDFVMFHLSYAELFFLDKCWPDFNRQDLEKVVQQFYQIERRFGQVLE